MAGAGHRQALLAELTGLAREQGILRLRALVAPGNSPALRLTRSLGDVLVHRYVDGAVELVVRLG